MQFNFLIKKAIKRALICLLISISLVGCDGNEAWCLTTAQDAYTSDTIKTVVNTVTTVNANGTDAKSIGVGGIKTYNQWVSSGVTVLEGDLVSISATGTAVLAPAYGLYPQYNIDYTGNPTEASNMAPYDAMTAGTFIDNQSQYYDNNGAGTQYIVKASESTLVNIYTISNTGDYVLNASTGEKIPFSFIPGQNITVTTAKCGTYNDSTPTKWTWSNGWKSNSVACQYKGKSQNSRNFTTSQPYCKAVKKCGNSGFISYSDYWAAWKCNFQNQIIGNYNSNSFSSSGTDVCGASGSNPGYNCGANATSKGLDPSFHDQFCGVSGSRDEYANEGRYDNWCGGKDTSGNVTHSKKAPSCDDTDSNFDLDTPVINKCGVVDTCWNTSGYRLYAVQTNVTSTCRVYPVDANCKHLYQVAGSTGSTVDQGSSFYAHGGPMALIIADPNVPGTAKDVSSLQAQYNSNVATIATNETNYNNAFSAIMSQLLEVNNYSGLDCSQISYFINTANTYAPYLSSSNVSIYNNLSAVVNRLITLNNNCAILDSQLAPGYVPIPDGSTPWVDTFNTIKSNIANAKASSSSLKSSIDSSAIRTEYPETKDLVSYQAFLDAVLSNMDTKTGVWSSSTLPGMRMEAATYQNSTTVSSSTKTSLNTIVSYLNSIQQKLNNLNYVLNDYSNDSLNKQISSSYIEPSTNTLKYDYTCSQDINANFCNGCGANGDGICPGCPSSSTLGHIYTVYSSWYNKLNNDIIPFINNTLQPAVNNLTDSSVSNYKLTLDNFVNSLSNAVNAAATSYLTSITTSSTIRCLNSANDKISTRIYESNTTPTGAIGGYTVFVKADPILASDGRYLQVVLSNGNPNNTSDATFQLPINTGSSGSCTMGGTTNKCDLTMSDSGVLWYKILDPDGVYTNNIGSYAVGVDQTTIANGFGRIFVQISNQISKGISSASNTIFNNLICANNRADLSYTCRDYLRSIHIILNLYVIIFGIMFLFGLIKIDYLDFLIRIVKIAVIISITQPDSYQFFYDYMFQAFLKFSNFLIASINGGSSDNPFAFLGQSIAALLLDPITYFKIFALMFQGLLGLVAFALIIYGTITFVKAVFNALMVYMMSFVGIGMCIVVAPIFFVFILFKTTQSLFDAWLKSIVRFTMEPAILFIGLIILNSMLVGIIQQLFNYAVCFKCTLPFGFEIPGVFSLGSDSLFCIPWFSPWGVDNVGSGKSFIIFMSIPLVLSFCMITKVMDIYSKKLSKEMTTAILGAGAGFGGNRKGSATMDSNPAKGFMKTMQKISGSTKNDKARRADHLVEKASKMMEDGSSPGGGSGSMVSGGGGAAPITPASMSNKSIPSSGTGSGGGTVRRPSGSAVSSSTTSNDGGPSLSLKSDVLKGGLISAVKGAFKSNVAFVKRLVSAHKRQIEATSKNNKTKKRSNSTPPDLGN